MRRGRENYPRMSANKPGNRQRCCEASHPARAGGKGKEDRGVDGSEDGKPKQAGQDEGRQDRQDVKEVILSKPYNRLNNVQTRTLGGPSMGNKGNAQSRIGGVRDNPATGKLAGQLSIIKVKLEEA